MFSTGGSRTRRRTWWPPQPAATPRSVPPTPAKQEPAPRLGQRERAGDGGRDRQLVGDQGGGVVEQPFALQDGDDPLRQAEPLGDGHGGDRVGRGHDGPEAERDRPRQPERGMGEHGHAAHGDQHEPDGQERDRAQVGPHLAHRDVQRGPVQQRRQEHQQGQVGVELDPRETRHEPDPDPDDHEQDRVGHARPRGQRDHHRDGGQEPQQQLDRFHAETLPLPLPLVEASRTRPGPSWSAATLACYGPSTADHFAEWAGRLPISGGGASPALPARRPRAGPGRRARRG